MIRFTKHALEKFGILKRRGFSVPKTFVLNTVNQPNVVDHSRLHLKIAQRAFDKRHVLRVVYLEENDTKIIVTFYPGRRTQYEKK